jgi:hypothetical protein
MVRKGRSHWRSECESPCPNQAANGYPFEWWAGAGLLRPHQERAQTKSPCSPSYNWSNFRRVRNMRKRKLTASDLRFISENMMLSGFSGRITKETAMHEPDMDAIAESAARFGAQIPSPQNRAPRPRIARFGSHPIDPKPNE